MALTKRSVKGSALTNAELDANFTHLGGDGTYPAPSTKGTAGQVLKMNAGATALEFATDATGSGGIASVVADTTPQLGGDLDVQTHSIVSVSNQNIAITPNGSGKVILDGLSHPTADGTNGQALTTDGSGNLTFNTLASSIAIQDEGNAVSVAPSILNFVGNGVTVTGAGNSTKTITISGGGGAGSTVYNNASSLPLSGNTDGDMAFAKDTNRLYVWNGSGWYSIALVNAAPTISSGATSLSLATDGSATVVTITASDPEGAPLTYAYSVTSGSLSNGGGVTATVVQGTGANINKFTITPTTTEAYAGTFTLTFTASDGVSTATSPATYTLVFATPQTRDAKLLMKTSGNNGRSNSVFDDSSTSNHSLTVAGDAFQSSFTPYGSNWSNKFDGTGDYISSATSSDYTIGSSTDWTVECWFYATAHTSGIYHSHTSALPGTNQGHALGINNASKLLLYQNGSNQTITSPTIELYTWYHVAISRASGSKKVFLNGRLVATISETEAYTGTYMTVGGYYSTGFLMNGYISDFHYIKGTAKYTAEFKPSDEKLTAHSNTKLLTCRSNRFMDESASPHTITATGDPQISTVNPYIVPDKWMPADNGSAYFDGAGDSLSIASTTDLTFGTGDFTIEFWVYIVSQSTAYASILDWRNSSQNDASAISITYDASKLYVYNAGFLVNNLPRKLNQWQHIVFQRRTIGGTPTNEFYMDGVSEHSGANSTNWTASTLKIGSSNWSDHGNFFISDLKINKGNAVYSAAFTPPTAPTSVDGNTVVKLNFTQAGIFDNALKHSFKPQGSVTESTTQTKYATTSTYFNGAYLEETNDNLIVRQGDMQIQFWLYMPSISGNEGYFHCSSNPAGSSTDGFAMYHSAAGTIYLYHGPGGSGWTQSTTMPTGQWVHHVYLRRNGRIQHFQNGVRQVDIANTADWVGNVIHIGNNYSGSNQLTGYMEDFQFLNGHTTYPFERPQTALTAVSGTSLQFATTASIPSSPNGLTLTASDGTPTVSSFTPSDTPVSYSYYYDGSSAHKIDANTAINFGNGDFTIEGYFWIDPNLASTYGTLFDTRDGNGGGNDNGAFGLAVTTSTMYVWSGAKIIPDFPTVTGKWNHLVYQRKTISGTPTHQMFRDGVLVGTSTTTRTFDNHPFYFGKSMYADWSRFYMTDFRIVKGTAIYSDSFTPPSAAL